jgi:hypothetical protein
MRKGDAPIPGTEKWTCTTCGHSMGSHHEYSFDMPCRYCDCSRCECEFAELDRAYREKRMRESPARYHGRMSNR